MPSKGRWALNPRKWFGSIANAAHKRDKKSQMNDPVVSIRTIPSTSTIPRLLPGRNKTKVMPSSSINENNTHINSTNAVASFTQFQLPAFNAQREKTSTLFNRTNPFILSRTQPSIRKNSQFSEELSIEATRWNTQAIIYDKSKLFLSPSLSSQYGNFQQESSLNKPIEMNLSNVSEQCLIDYPQNSLSTLKDKCILLTRTQSSSSLDDNDEHDESSSSGIFTDERTDLNDHQRTASKDTLSTLDVLSIESIADSQTSLNHYQSRPMIHHYRLPEYTYEPMNNKSAQQPHQIPITRSYRARSAEGILKDSHIGTPITIRNRQSSAAIVKKIEKRIPTSRSPTAKLEKSGLVRVANDTYRLTINKDDHLYCRQRQNSLTQYSTYDDSLPPANDEESYATLPRTSSTEQLNTNLQNDLRAIVDDCLKPMVASIGKSTTYRSIKTHHRSKRSQITNEQSQINIEDITDKLLSSIDCSIYAQYQRCY